MEYTTYQVDLNALAAGVPIESLTKKNHVVVEQVKTLPSDPGEFKNTKHLYQNDSTFKPPKRKEPSIIEVDVQTYQRIIKNQLVKAIGGNPGQVYKIVNKQSGRFVIRQLYPVGEYKYLARVVDHV